MEVWLYGKASSSPVREEVFSILHNWHFCNSHHWFEKSHTFTIASICMLFMTAIAFVACWFTNTSLRQHFFLVLPETNATMDPLEWTSNASVKPTYTRPQTKGRRERLHACCWWPSLQTVSPQQHSSSTSFRKYQVQKKTPNGPYVKLFLNALAHLLQHSHLRLQ